MEPSPHPAKERLVGRRRHAKSHTAVISAGQTSKRNLSCRAISEPTLVRSHIPVSCVEQHLIKAII